MNLSMRAYLEAGTVIYNTTAGSRATTDSDNHVTSKTAPASSNYILKTLEQRHTEALSLSLGKASSANGDCLFNDTWETRG